MLVFTLFTFLKFISNIKNLVRSKSLGRQVQTWGQRSTYKQFPSWQLAFFWHHTQLLNLANLNTGEFQTVLQYICICINTNTIQIRINLFSFRNRNEFFGRKKVSYGSDFCMSYTEQIMLLHMLNLYSVCSLYFMMSREGDIFQGWASGVPNPDIFPRCD